MTIDKDIAAATRAVTVTPHLTQTFSPCRALYVGGAGNLTVELVGSSQVTFHGVPAGTILPIAAVRVAPASTATHFIALY